jgi:hypothetical protein
MVGCTTESAPSPSATGASDGLAPDAVSVDFYGDGKVAAACSGTLLSSNVVLTSAHCAAGSKGARVHTAAGQASEVAKVMLYDWGTTQDHAQEHDLALLVLRTPMSAARYATVSSGPCVGCVATAHGRAGAAASKRIAIEPTAPVGRPFSLRFQREPEGAVAGGAVTGPDGSLIGVYAGRGARTGQGYVTRLDMAEVQIWLRSVVESRGGHFQSTSPLSPLGSVKVQNTGTGGGGGTGSSTTGGDGTGEGTATTDGSDEPGAPEEGVGDPGTSPDTSAEPAGGETPGPYGGEEGEKPGSDPPDGYKREVGPNSWVSSRPGDPALAREAEYAKKFPDATVVSTHGEVGRMVDTPSADTLKMLTMGKDGPMIVGACYAGAKDGDGNRVTGQLADAAGVSRDKTYGCTGTSVTPTGAGSMYCDGNWVDGNGKTITDEQRGKYNLKNCVITTRDSNGNWKKYSCN